MSNILTLEELLTINNNHYVGEVNFVEIDNDYYPFVKGHLRLSPKEFLCPRLTTEKKVAGVYLFWSSQTGGTYIGSSGEVGKRLSQHRADIKAKRHSCRNVHDLLPTHTLMDFEVIVIFTKDREQAFDFEQKLIDEIKSPRKLLNIAADARISMKGRSLSPEHKQSLLAANVGRIKSSATRKNISEGLKAAHAAHPEYGRKFSETRKSSAAAKAQLESIRELVQKKILLNGVLYPSIVEAARQTGRGESTIRRRFKMYGHCDPNGLYVLNDVTF